MACGTATQWSTYYSVIKRNELLMPIITDEFQNNHAEWEKTDINEYCMIALI